MQSALVAQGFHFTATTTIPLSPPADCSLHVLHVLPPDVYADQYEFAQRDTYSMQLHGSSDLELPVAAVDPAESVLLLRVFLPTDGSPNVTLDVPLHARYGDPVPALQSPYHTIALTPPTAFWACPASDASVLPDELAPHIPSDLLGSSRLFIIPYAAAPPHLQVTIPVGVSDDLYIVDIGTTAVMLLMFAYVVNMSLKTARRLHAPPQKLE